MPIFKKIEVGVKIKGKIVICVPVFDFDSLDPLISNG